MGEVDQAQDRLGEDRRDEIKALLEMLEHTWKSQPQMTLSQIINKTLDPQSTRFDQFKELMGRDDPGWAKRLKDVEQQERIAQVQASQGTRKIGPCRRKY